MTTHGRAINTALIAAVLAVLSRAHVRSGRERERKCSDDFRTLKSRCIGYGENSRRLLFFNEDKIYLVDSQSKRVHEVFSIAPRHFRGFTASRDDRLIYLSIETTEADIWLITLEEGKD